MSTRFGIRPAVRTAAGLPAARARRANLRPTRRCVRDDGGGRQVRGAANAAWEQNNVSRVKQLLKETATAPRRGFEWYYWQRQNASGVNGASRTHRGRFWPWLTRRMASGSRPGVRIIPRRLMYTDDNDDMMPLTELDNGGPPHYRARPGFWVSGNAVLDVSPTNLQAGTLYPYAQAVGVYRCPSERTKTNPQGGKRFDVNRSYTVNATLNAKGGMVVPFPPRPFVNVVKLSAGGYARVWSSLSPLRSASCRVIPSSHFTYRAAGDTHTRRSSGFVQPPIKAHWLQPAAGSLPPRPLDVRKAIGRNGPNLRWRNAFAQTPRFAPSHRRRP